jgi:hypothetical protein
MIREYTYQLSELDLNLDDLNTLLGFPEGSLPEPFDEYVEQALSEVESLCNIRAAFLIKQDVSFSSYGNSIYIDGKELLIGKTVTHELKNSSSIALFICTAGEGISLRSQELLSNVEDPVLGYVFDLLGSMIVEAATNRLQNFIKQIMAEEGLLITNRYNPGYCQWNVADQHKLFSFFPERCCGITLTPSALMHPIKSVSGIIGIGKEVAYRNYICDLCSQTNCIHRSLTEAKKVGI